MSEKKTILILDDDSDILQLCSFFLKRKGFEVYAKESCNNIIQMMEDMNPDIVLMDNWIPDIGGIESTKLIKNHTRFKTTPVVFFSANNDIKKLAEKAGADDYIAKPFELVDLENRISKHINS